MQIPLKDQKTIFIAYKVCDFVGKVEISLYSRNHFGAMLLDLATLSWSTLILARIRFKKLIRSVSCIHKVKNALKSFGAIKTKIPFC